MHTFGVRPEDIGVLAFAKRVTSALWPPSLFFSPSFTHPAALSLAPFLRFLLVCHKFVFQGLEIAVFVTFSFGFVGCLETVNPIGKGQARELSRYFSIVQNLNRFLKIQNSALAASPLFLEVDASEKWPISIDPPIIDRS